MKVTSLRYLDAKFHHPSLGESPPNRGNRISCVQNSRKMENRNSVNNSAIGILCSKNSNERLAVPAVAGLLVFFIFGGAAITDLIVMLAVSPVAKLLVYHTDKKVASVLFVRFVCLCMIIHAFLNIEHRGLCTTSVYGP